MIRLKAETYKADENTEILARKNDLIYYFHNSAAGMVTICDEETNLIIMQKCFGSKKEAAIEWVKNN